FRIEQQEYAKEKIEWTSDIGRSSSDNQPILDILTKRSYGIFHLLDDECCFPKGTDESFLLKCHYNHIDNPLYSKSKSHEPEFCIRHFGGPVWYEVPGFLEKNRDTVKGQVTNLFKDNQNPVIAQMFKARSATVSLPIENDGKAQKSATVSSSFILSMNMLIQKLSKNKAHFIRCIKPNQDKIPSNFDLRFVSEQIRRLGFLDTVKLRRVGYPVKYVTKDFTFR
uniref:Myosin motor domain-containing protein n=1 Tax=Romanomermis culicivorax TaxID=13658 RepID=A0A915L2W9_ROMCU